MEEDLLPLVVQRVYGSASAMTPDVSDSNYFRTFW